jgi:glycosyltransferase involved in cell wall biosynthesis
LYKNVVWHASTEFEKLDIKRVFGENVNIQVAPNIPGKKREITEEITNTNNILKLVFLSRITPKKNLDFALELLKELDFKVDFAIYGTKEDISYWEKCEKIIESLPSNIQVHYEGPVEHSRVAEVFTNAHIFLFPTKGENYGHVIVESLCAGTPVMISDQTPWISLEKEGVGWVIPLNDIEIYQLKLTEYFRLILQNNLISRKKVSEWIHDKINDPEIIEKNIKLFEIL